jgi:prepilin-type N-terminal cleavage/methylation domain-containing protein/prepilin-type processing-associated H-X9-DG protein
MTRWPQRPAQNRAFTLVEVLVVIAVVGILAALLLPALARAKDKAVQAGCTSNLKQVGIALQVYVDDNEGLLPGPAWAGARASYDRDSSTELIWFLAHDLGAPAPATVRPGRPVVAEVFVCPGYRRKAPGLTSLVGRKCYLLNDDVDPEAERVPPFGYPAGSGAPAIPPLPHNAISKYASPSSVFAITDLDKAMWQDPSGTPGWYDDLPYTPVHGSVRNQLFFDWHVEAVKAW